MPSTSDSVEVVIAGGGPVGTGLAIDLSLRGIDVCVVERRRSPQQIPKGQNLTQRTGEHFRRWGVSDAIRAATPIPPQYGNEGLTAYRSLLSGYHYDWFKRASVREYYAADNERLPQYETERVLRERAAQLSALQMRLGWQVTTIETTGDGVRVDIEDELDGTSRTLQAKFVVGCDGAHSHVRETAGITETVDARGRRMALLVFRSHALHTLLEARFPGKTIFNALDPAMQGYWQFLGRVDLEGTWFFHAPVPDGVKADYDFAALLQRAVGTSFDFEFLHVGFWDLRFAHANQYRRGRIFIAGDAAHSHPPYGGYGVNVGFEDARNLSWKLAAHLQGWGSEHLLDSYAEERHPVFASTRDHFIARMIDDDAQFLRRYDPDIDRAGFERAWAERASAGQAEVQLYVPNYAGSSIVWGQAGARSGAVAAHRHEAQAGFHLAPLDLPTGRPVYDSLADDFTLIALGQSNAVAQAFSTAAVALGIPLTVLAADIDAAASGWSAHLILVRPDHFVAYAANELHVSADEILRRAAGIA